MSQQQQNLSTINVRDLNFCPYEVLGLKPLTPTNKDVSSAFRKMSLIWHPDRNKAANARDKFEQIKAASLILLSETDRKNYDALYKVRQEAKERMERQGADRKKIIEELLRREKEYQDQLRGRMGSDGSFSTTDESYRKAESEMEKLIREVKLQEQEERKDEKQKKRQDHISEHYDQTTIKIKMKAQTQESEIAMSEDSVRSIMSEYGTLDGIIIDKEGRVAFAMFKYRDHALKVIQNKDNNTTLNGYKLRLYSTSKAQDREERKKKKFMRVDPIERLKAKYLSTNNGGFSFPSGSYKVAPAKSLEELESEVFEKIKQRKRNRQLLQQQAQ
ncbi:dnajc17 protein [Stylonychia lemnae]|uniref:Dnajc17 protein n=1 Tax=Stylonychia lemnae TaxID=5949 RepID=A0A078B4H9_STYLE|nr:dnajc17 protein [Stylonychia lemnae]|eukprot:CDW89430.1 dnajc17 protein [Stylonychia lemnae]